MPQVLAVLAPSNPVFDVIFALLLRTAPCIPRFITVVGMNRIEPTKAEAFGGVEPGEFNPLRAGPSPAPVGARQENKLRNAGGQKAKALLVFAQSFTRSVLLSAIARD